MLPGYTLLLSLYLDCGGFRKRGGPLETFGDYDGIMAEGLQRIVQTPFGYGSWPRLF